MKRLSSLEQNKILFMAVAVLVSCYSCTKGEPFNVQPGLSFKMSGQAYSFASVTATAKWSCGYRLYEISALTPDNQFFKINFTAIDTLKPGGFYMDEIPTNSVPGSCTFWYSGNGRSYTAKYFSINITSYEGHIINGNFGGGSIASGRFNNIKVSEE